MAPVLFLASNYRQASFSLRIRLIAILIRAGLIANIMVPDTYSVAVRTSAWHWSFS